MWSFPSAQPWWDTWVLHSLLGSPVQEMQGVQWKATKWLRDWRIWHIRRGWENSDCSSCKIKDSGGILSGCINTCWGQGRKQKPNFSQWYPAIRPEAKQVLTDTQKFCSNVRKKHYCCKNDKLRAVCWGSISGSPSLEIFQTNLDTALSSQTKLILLW